MGGVVPEAAADAGLLHVASMLQTERGERETPALSELQSHSIVKPFKRQVPF